MARCAKCIEDNHALACNFAKYAPILNFFSTHRLSNEPFLIRLLTTPPHLKYAATLPCNLLLMACFVVINVSQGSVATYARCGGIFRIFSIYLTTNLRRNLPVEIFLNLFVFDRIVVMSLWPHFFGPPFSSCYERHYPLGHAANRTERERDGFSRLEAWAQLSCGSLFFFFFLYYAIHGSTPAHKHRLLTTKNASRLHLKYKNVNTSLKAPSCAR